MAVQIINKSKYPLPQYETKHSAGMDLRANIEEALTLQPMQRMLIPTGLFIALEENTEAQIRPRSGMAYKQGLTVLNSPGTIDADYRGEIKVLLVNLSGEPQTIQPGDRVAQMIVASYVRVDWVETEELGETMRGEGGFGSTGKQ
ncbi:MAG: dUTP diphosphatase [Flavobacteriales bacterium]